MTTLNTLRAFVILTLFGSQLGLAGCGSDNNAEPAIPFVAFNEQLNLTNQEYSALRFNNGVAYHAGGVRGLVIVRQNASSYLAFDRNCSYKPYDACARVHIDASRLFLADSCCGSVFNLQGQVQGGPANRPLRQYTTSLSGNILTIIN
ncbi:hypothetical protein [Hymenobacter sp. BT491]|uniref:hypothetical protein n=1 Tax=Hymenobacter sp. BT491 TaxID=2766779 RepID=UPI001653A914|nr:hypothetical protein [Hymenobacter sp. BT491]MBC6991206.1 hypothetical protein [Hymenobacter sp. BT491]